MLTDAWLLYAGPRAAIVYGGVVRAGAIEVNLSGESGFWEGESSLIVIKGCRHSKAKGVTIHAL